VDLPSYKMVIRHSYVNVYQRVPPPVCFSYLVPFGTLSDGIQPPRFMDRAIPDALMIGLFLEPVSAPRPCFRGPTRFNFEGFKRILSAVCVVVRFFLTCCSPLSWLAKAVVTCT
jgi:hypothetical protein